MDRVDRVCVWRACECLCVCARRTLRPPRCVSAGPVAVRLAEMAYPSENVHLTICSTWSSMVVGTDALKAVLGGGGLGEGHC
jgi:hypothetical protein